MLFCVVDDRSGAAYQEYRCVYGEDVESGRAVFRRYVLAARWTSETDRAAAAERDGRDLVVNDDEGHVVATVFAEELCVMRESRGRLLGEPPTVAQTR